MVSGQQPEGSMREFCEEETFEASCPANSVIIMTSATYGRMQLGRCVNNDFGNNIGCAEDVLYIMDTFCSGRRRCDFKVDDLMKHSTPCMIDLTSYLAASYSCEKVLERSSSCPDQGVAQLEDEAGSISPLLSKCPLRVQLPPGNIIKITMLAFQTPESLSGFGPVCTLAGTIKEGTLSQDVQKCTNDPREKTIYVSSGNSVGISLSSGKINTTGHFILRYKGMKTHEQQSSASSHMDCKACLPGLGLYILHKMISK